jgi:hypothetical protein
MAFSLVRCLVKYSLKYVGDSLGGGIIPIGSIASGMFDDWCQADRNKTPAGAAKTQPSAAAQAELRGELEQISQDGAGYRRQVEATLAEMAADQPEPVRQAALSYLSQVPGRLQKSMRRPEDPTGRTIPPGLQLRRADDFQQLLPERMPRFKTGDQALPGTDLVVAELLGVGGFGEVWKAVHRSRPHAPPVALKFCTDEAAARSLRKEVDLLDRVATHGRHPGIVELKYAHLEAATPCLEYELVEGGDLAALIVDLFASGQAMPLKMTRLFHSLTEAVGFAHRLDPPIVHRDLKPANILTKRLDGRVQLKVADFGIGGIASSREIKEWAGETAAASGTGTESTGSCTPLYASPQQRRFGPPDVRDDVYALGVIWYQMLAGDPTREPPRGGSWKKHLLQQGATREMIALLERCIEDDPGERPADAQALADALKGVLASADGSAIPYAQLAVAESPARAATVVPTIARTPRPGPRAVHPAEWQHAHVAGRIVINAQMMNGAMWVKIALDGRTLGECRLLNGCALPFETTAGAHLLEVTSGIVLRGNKTRRYTLSLTESGSYRITLQPTMGFLGMQPGFGEAVDIQRLAS